ncbi:hypothetical protein [Streptomyces cavernae]|uniref:hypothetical protein n=1 Tax=Streptomyces cavernae TaxID=2259034 RepID=UPI000FEB98D2|nr:hypothetical protein [Streptomyces cavernae]
MTRRFLPAISACAAVLLAAGCSSPAPQPTAAAPAVTVTQTITLTPTPTSTPVASQASAIPTPTVSPAPEVAPARIPQGSVALTEWHNGDATNECVNVMTVYENRSDTAVISITQKFQTMYTPKHADGEYPDDVDGPVKTLTQDAGIAPYGTRTLYWQVCAPELASKQNPVPPDGTDSFMSEIGAQPRAIVWNWAQ